MFGRVLPGTRVLMLVLVQAVLELTRAKWNKAQNPSFGWAVVSSPPTMGARTHNSLDG